MSAATNNIHPISAEINLEPVDNERLANLCGASDAHLRQIERRLGVEINHRGNAFRVIGGPKAAAVASRLLTELYAAAQTESLSTETVHLWLQDKSFDEAADEAGPEEVTIKTKRSVIKGRSPNQRQYLRNISERDVSFGIGPAGTGKTYLAVASAVAALERGQVRRLVLVRPAVEAGEKLGYLPGDLAQKVDPYLRPLYDALYEMLGFDRVMKHIEKNVIEVAPLAFMRGRTLNESFIILDEAQNTTIEQMKMFLTRVGFGSRAVVTGDITQIDLPQGKPSGLRHVIEVLKGQTGISFAFFTSRDVVRHPLVARILDAYEHHENNARGQRPKTRPAAP